MNLSTFILTVLILGTVGGIIYRQFKTKGHCEHCESECAVKHSQSMKGKKSPLSK